MEKIKKIERPGTLQSLVYDNIKGLLLSGQLEFETIYSANQFAEILGVSRTPVREALLQLTAEGLLASVHGRGFKIKDFSKKELRDFFETRKMIEVYVIENLSRDMDGLDFGALENTLETMKEKTAEGDSNGFLEADKIFHMSLVHHYNNNLLASIMENIRDLISIFGQKALSRPGRPREVIDEHQAILDALKLNDTTKAVQSTMHHLNVTENYLIEIL